MYASKNQKQKKTFKLRFITKSVKSFMQETIRHATSCGCCFVVAAFLLLCRLLLLRHSCLVPIPIPPPMPILIPTALLLNLCGCPMLENQFSTPFLTQSNTCCFARRHRWRRFLLSRFGFFDFDFDFDELELELTASLSSSWPVAIQVATRLAMAWSGTRSFSESGTRVNGQVEWGADDWSHSWMAVRSNTKPCGVRTGRAISRNEIGQHSSSGGGPCRSANVSKNAFSSASALT